MPWFATPPPPTWVQNSENGNSNVYCIKALAPSDARCTIMMIIHLLGCMSPMLRLNYFQILIVDKLAFSVPGCFRKLFIVFRKWNKSETLRLLCWGCCLRARPRHAPLLAIVGVLIAAFGHAGRHAPRRAWDCYLRARLRLLPYPYALLLLAIVCFRRFRLPFIHHISISASL